jgi:hypothetical protein
MPGITKPFSFVRMDGVQAPTPRRPVGDEKLDREFMSTDQALDKQLTKITKTEARIDSLPIVGGKLLAYSIAGGAAQTLVHSLGRRPKWIIVGARLAPPTVYDSTAAGSEGRDLTLTNTSAVQVDVDVWVY